jgi:hypothetical protein
MPRPGKRDGCDCGYKQFRTKRNPIGAVSFLTTPSLIKVIVAPEKKRAMPLKTEANVKKTTEADLKVGLICADRDGNRIRIDRIHIDGDKAEAGTLFYHFLNDELRVQEGIQERSIKQFLAEGWYTAAPGRSL